MMVAREEEEVIPVKDADKIQAFIAKMVAALDAIQSLPFYGINTDFLKVLKRKEQVMKMMLLLFDIFEKVNNAFSAYIQLDPQGGFWRGNVPALLMVMPYTAIQFTVLHQLKTLASGSSKSEDHIRLSSYLSYVTGALAGCASTVGSYPFDLLRTILASRGEPKVYPNMRTAFVSKLQHRGIRGLYAGSTPTLIEIVPYAGLQFGTYDTFKRWTMAWNRYSSSHANESGISLSSFQLFLCGLAAGTRARAICHPLNVIKKRFQCTGWE